MKYNTQLNLKVNMDNKEQKKKCKSLIPIGTIVDFGNSIEGIVLSNPDNNEILVGDAKGKCSAIIFKFFFNVESK